MALPNTGITTSMVANEIGAGTNNVGALCVHPNINKWSRWKPVIYPSVAGLNLTNLTSVNFGLTPPSSSTNYEAIVSSKWTYSKPTGGASSPFRIGDFRNYNHSASPICVIESSSSVNRTFITEKKVTMLMNVSGTNDLIGLSDFSGVIGSLYYGIVVVDGTSKFIKTASNTLSNSGLEISLDLTQAPFNSDKTVQMYHILSSKSVTTLTELGLAGAITYRSIPSADAVTNITSLEITSGLGIYANILGLGESANQILNNIDTYTIVDAPAFPTSGALYLKIELSNNTSNNVVIPSGTWQMSANPTYFGTNTNKFGASLYDNSGNPISTITVPANSSVIVRVGTDNLLNMDGASIGTPTPGMQVQSTFMVYYNGTQITGNNIKFTA